MLCVQAQNKNQWTVIYVWYMFPSQTNDAINGKITLRCKPLLEIIILIRNPNRTISKHCILFSSTCSEVLPFMSV